MDFKKEFMAEVKRSKPNWIIAGAISSKDKIYTLGTDTKVLSSLFELITYPLIKRIALKFKLEIELSQQQTVYPDFTLLKSKEDTKKVAVDVKSTYLKFYKNGKIKPFNFTLGSYTSFLRNNTKNILYPYNEYAKHWIIGFVYKRAEDSEPQEVDLKNRSKIIPSYNSVKFFVQEKYKITGDKPGSGNTANIGSFKSANITDFDKGKGPFTKLGKKTFHEYWANYDRDPPREYTNLEEFFSWKNRQQKN